MTARTFRTPSGTIDAVVHVPGSKSVANRALICAALAEGESEISGLPDGDDTTVVIDVLYATNRILAINDGSVVVNGSPTLVLPGIVDARLAGTSSRFLTAVAALGAATTIVDGEGPLRSRPMQELHDALEQLGAVITPLGEVGHLPVSVTKGRLTGGVVEMSGDVSSQFISALMLIGPVLPDGLRIDVRGALVSRPYVEMTAHVMRAFGADVDVRDSVIGVKPGGYRATNYRIEPDFSSAAFPLCAVALRPGQVRIPGLAESRLQGDSALLDILGSMGLEVEVDDSDVVVRRDNSIEPIGIDVDMGDCSDLVPAVAVAALACRGATVIRGVGFIRHKESDRLGDLASELSRLGADVEVFEDGLRIIGRAQLMPAHLGTHHDHRLAMSFALTSLMVDGVVVDESEVVSKSWPSYFDDMTAILGPSEER